MTNPEPSPETKAALRAAGDFIGSVLFGAAPPRRLCRGCGRTVSKDNAERIHDNGICAKRLALRQRQGWKDPK